MYLVGGCQQSSGRLRAILWLFFFGSRDSVILQVVLVVVVCEVFLWLFFFGSREENALALGRQLE